MRLLLRYENTLCNSVIDLDACLWDEEMFELSELPSTKIMGDLNGRGNGVVGVMSGQYDQISLHSGALLALQNHVDGKHLSLKLALP